MKVSLEMPKEVKGMGWDPEAMLSPGTAGLHAEAQSSTLPAQSPILTALVSPCFISWI